LFTQIATAEMSSSEHPLLKLLTKLHFCENCGLQSLN